MLIKPINILQINQLENVQRFQQTNPVVQDASKNRTMELSDFNVGRAILAQNNIAFRNLSTPIEVTDRYNKKVEGKDHLDLPNIHVYEYPDTNLQVFINIDENSTDDKNKIFMKLNIDDNTNKEISYVKKELCIRLLCNLINYENDDCLVTSFDSKFFGVVCDLKTKNYNKISYINEMLSKPNFTDEKLTQVKNELITELESLPIKDSIYDNVISEINNTNLANINDYYFNTLKNSEAQLFVIIDKNYYEKNKQQLNKEFNANIFNKFLKHKEFANNIKSIVNDKQMIFSKPTNDVFLEFQYSMPMDTLKNRKIADYLSQLMLLYRAPYISENSSPIKFKLDSELQSKIENKPISPYLRFKITPIGNEKIKNIEQAISAYKGMLYTLCENESVHKTLSYLKEKDKDLVKKHFIQNTDVYKKSLLLSESKYDVFKIYELIDSITIEDIEQALNNYIINQEPVIYINMNKNPYLKEKSYV